MRPFEGLKVLDFFWVVIGPMTTSYLAEYGATVVRIESRGRPEVLRKAGVDLRVESPNVGERAIHNDTSPQAEPASSSSSNGSNNDQRD